MSRIIAIANHKGGVGKTTTVVSLGVALSRKGYRVLLIDLDSQANLTESLLEEEPKETVYKSMKTGAALPVVDIPDNLIGTLALVPSSLDLAGLEIELSGTAGKEYLLRNLIKPITGKYDYILIDCPPSLSLITVNAFTAADELYIPLTAEALPFRGLTKIQKVIDIVRSGLNPQLRLSGIIFTRWEGRKINRIVEDALRDAYGETVFKAKIRTNVAVIEAPLARQDIFTYSPNSAGAKDYTALTEEVIERGKKWQ